MPGPSTLETALRDKVKRLRRQEQNREAQARKRAKLSEQGAVVVQLILTGEDARLWRELRERQRGPVAGFERRALLVGGKFLANAGNPRGSKVRTAR